MACQQWTIGASFSSPNGTQWPKMAGGQVVGDLVTSERLATAVRLESFISPNSIVSQPNLSTFSPAFRSATGSERRCSFA